MEFNDDPIVKIMVMGVGGGGNNAVNHMVNANLVGCEFVAINTDKQVLRVSKADKKLVIGEKLTKGRGVGGNPEVGQRAAEESREEIEALLQGVDLLFITSGMGGGTGTGASPVVASIARKMGILTVGVVTKPFDFEGAHKMENAERGIRNLTKFVDSIIVIPNQKLMEMGQEKLSMIRAFQIADDTLRQGVQGLIDMIVATMYINMDFADVENVLRNAGVAHMGVGRAKGPDRLLNAIKMAVQSPIVETNISGATKIVMSVKGGEDLDVDEVNNCGKLVQSVVDPGCNIKYAVDMKPEYNDEVQVFIVAAGFKKQSLETKHEEFIREQQRIREEQAAIQVQPDQPFRPRQEQMFDEPIDNTPSYLKKLRKK